MRTSTAAAVAIFAVACAKPAPKAEPPAGRPGEAESIALVRGWLQAAARDDEYARFADLLRDAELEVEDTVVTQVGDDAVDEVDDATYVVVRGARAHRTVELIVAVGRDAQGAPAIGAVRLAGTAPFAVGDDRGDDLAIFLERWLDGDAAAHLDAAQIARFQRVLGDAIVDTDGEVITVGLSTGMIDEGDDVVGLLLSLRREPDGSLTVVDVEVLDKK